MTYRDVHVLAGCEEITTCPLLPMSKLMLHLLMLTSTDKAMRRGWLRIEYGSGNLIHTSRSTDEKH